MWKVWSHLINSMYFSCRNIFKLSFKVSSYRFFSRPLKVGFLFCLLASLGGKQARQPWRGFRLDQDLWEILQSHHLYWLSWAREVPEDHSLWHDGTPAWFLHAHGERDWKFIFNYFLANPLLLFCSCFCPHIFNHSSLCFLSLHVGWQQCWHCWYDQRAPGSSAGPKRTCVCCGYQDRHVPS